MKILHWLDQSSFCSVSQYLQNTTQDVLVVGPNITTQSDLRIFSSDGNTTMKRSIKFLFSSYGNNNTLTISSFLDSDTFSNTCGALLERMFNTVPSNVNLTDPISEPFDYVINDPFFSYQDGAFIMLTALRVRVHIYSCPDIPILITVSGYECQCEHHGNHVLG